MQWALIVCIVAVGTLLVFLAIQSRKHKEYRNHILAFVITIAGTFSGVFLVFYLDNIETQRREKKRLDSYYEVILYDLSRYKYVLDRMVEKHEKGNPIFKTFRPFEGPRTPDLFIGEANLYKYMSRPLKMYLFYYSQCYREIVAICRSTSDPEIREMSMRYFSHILGGHIKFLKEEREYLFGKRTDKDMSLVFKRLVEEENEFRSIVRYTPEESSTSKPKGQ